MYISLVFNCTFHSAVRSSITFQLIYLKKGESIVFLTLGQVDPIDVTRKSSADNKSTHHSDLHSARYRLQYHF